MAVLGLASLVLVIVHTLAVGLRDQRRKKPGYVPTIVIVRRSGAVVTVFASICAL